MTIPPLLSRLPAAVVLLVASPLASSQDAGSAEPPPGSIWVTESTASMVGMRGIPMLFLLGVVIALLLYANQRGRRKQEMLVQYLERGLEVPPGLLPEPFYGKQLTLRRGIGMTCLAIGLGLACWLGTGDLEVAAWALIPLSLGIASFINAALPDPRSEPRR